MRMFKNVLLLSLVVLAACSPVKKITSLEDEMNTLFRQEQYSQVLERFSEVEALSIKGKLPLSDATLLVAAQAAHQSGNYEQSAQLFQQIETALDGATLMMAGKNLQELGRSAEELAFWSDNLPSLTEESHKLSAYKRQFALLRQLGSYEEAAAVWPQLQSLSDPDLMYAQVEVLDKLDKKSEALKLNDQILTVDGEHEGALFFKADYYYHKAENWYQDEMTKYNRNANYTTYAYLRRELKKISTDFRTARDLLEKLHQLQPENRLYVGYLVNTYTRLEMRNEANAMKNKLQELQNQ